MASAGDYVFPTNSRLFPLDTRRGMIVWGVIGYSLALCGPIGLFWSIEQSATALQSRSWPQADATIVRSRVVEIATPHSKRFAPEIEYHFQVNGKVYQGSRIAFGPLSLNSKEDIQEIVATKYAHGSKHRVWYDPRTPEISVLEPGLRFENYFYLIAAAAATLLGPTILLDQVQEWRRRKGPPK